MLSEEQLSEIREHLERAQNPVFFFSKWIRSHRDLPLKINQWCNVMRWEVKQTKLFLRSREFLWQEGHCAYETEKDCEKDVLLILEEYKKLIEDLLAIPVIAGEKTKKELFPGAKRTYTLESLMPDGKALQMGTSHNLGQGFSKAFNVKFIDKNEKEQFVWLNSWGFSTRLIGALVMSHSDDKGLILPPKIASEKVVIIPIIKDKESNKILKKSKDIEKSLKSLNPILDDRTEYTPGWKYNEYELKGIPIRVELGPRDIKKNQVVVVRRDTGKKEFVKINALKKHIDKELDNMQNDLFKKADNLLKKSITSAETFKELIKEIKNKKIVKVKFCNTIDCEDKIKDETNGATSRCIVNNFKVKKGDKCVRCNESATCEVYFSKSY